MTVVFIKLVSGCYWHHFELVEWVYTCTVAMKTLALILLLICFCVLNLVPLWVFLIITSTLVNIVNNCFRITPCHEILGKLIVFLQLEHVLMDQMCETSAAEANRRIKILTCLTYDIY